MNLSEIAAKSMLVEKMNCAQAVLTTFCEELGMEKMDALRVAMGFGGGMGNTGGTCGAVTGAYMVIGLKMNLESNDLPTCKEKASALVKEFTKNFIQRCQSTLCGDLLGYDLRDPAQLEAAKAAGVFGTRCPDLVREAVKVLETLKYE
jgi:C_GCAxxG_C_C family probable redox protein